MFWIRKVHKWASVIVGIQLLLWLISGLYFNLMDHNKAQGLSYRSDAHAVVAVETHRLVEPKMVLGAFKPSVSLSLITLLDKPYYLLTHEKGLYKHLRHDYTLVNAYQGKPVLIDVEFAQRLARESYSGEAQISSTNLLIPPLDDFPKQQNDTWQINFADDIATSVYIEAQSGRLVGHSDEHKRLAEVFFMLHFMDYFNEGGFNTIPIKIFAFITLWLTFSGFIWVIDMLKRHKYRPKWKPKSALSTRETTLN
ncbi:PepSY domain-containing protein [Shewanella psychromarinicola]|uniref:PepSY-associated TM helix n=1 Tax=Shewanella psychromarinicola TaxID=2487742 RepID=A0A3N4E4M5_9GAMM|nr:PepSY domain-containing protein [Shewanella psychromarinicola]AZG34033.1 hypothetical protein EGC80_03180 [Shewanella psychromarinicola]MCL1081308.1 PepSY domain-containing protein [Shewanella psychromarinicola]RPA32126.1 hypothetical protein EGC77_09775 [Shewanella psychromarinicola]